MIEFWYQALAADVGIVITTDDPTRCIQKLYAARKEAGDLELDSISIVRSPTNPVEIWLVKRHGQAQVRLPDAESDPQSV